MADVNYQNPDFSAPQSATLSQLGIGVNPNAGWQQGLDQGMYDRQLQNKLSLQNMGLQSAALDLQNKQYAQPSIQSGYDLNQAKNVAGQVELPSQTLANVATSTATANQAPLSTTLTGNKVKSSNLELGQANQKAIGEAATNLSSQFASIDKQYGADTIGANAAKSQAQATLYDQLTSSGVHLDPSWRTYSPQTESHIHAAASGYSSTPSYNQELGTIAAKGAIQKDVANIDVGGRKAVAGIEQTGATSRSTATNDMELQKAKIMADARIAQISKYEGQIQGLLAQKAQFEQKGQQMPPAKMNQLKTLMGLSEEAKVDNEFGPNGSMSFWQMQHMNDPDVMSKLYNMKQKAVTDRINARLGGGQIPAAAPQAGQPAPAGGNNNGGLPPGYSIKQVQ